MVDAQVIVKIRGSNSQKIVTIPKNCKLKIGDYVIIKKLEITNKKIKIK